MRYRDVIKAHIHLVVFTRIWGLVRNEILQTRLDKSNVPSSCAPPDVVCQKLVGQKYLNEQMWLLSLLENVDAKTLQIFAFDVDL